jgi:hypothetical protein
LGSQRVWETPTISLAIMASRSRDPDHLHHDPSVGLLPSHASGVASSRGGGRFAASSTTPTEREPYVHGGEEDGVPGTQVAYGSIQAY